MSWQPIETAPYFAEGDRVLCLCRWDDLPQFLTWSFDESSARYCWKHEDGDTDDPTHWYPLPDPPEENKELEEEFT